MRYALLAVLVAACALPADQHPVAPPKTANLARPTLAVGHGPVQSMAISPTSATIAVGESIVLTATYFDKKGNAFTVDDQPLTFWGCREAGCFSTVSILPSHGLGGPNDPAAGATATITGLSVGVVTIYALDGLGHEVEIQLTVT